MLSVNLVPIARNYYDGLLMCPESEVHDLSLAEQEIKKALDESGVPAGNERESKLNT